MTARRDCETMAFFVGAVPIGMTLNNVMDSSSHGLFFVIVTIAACGFTCEYIVRQFFTFREMRERDRYFARIRERLNQPEGNSDSIPPSPTSTD